MSMEANFFPQASRPHIWFRERTVSMVLLPPFDDRLLLLLVPAFSLMALKAATVTPAAIKLSQRPLLSHHATDVTSNLVIVCFWHLYDLAWKCNSLDFPGCG